MTKYVCMVLGMIQSEGSVHGEEERGGNGRKPLQGLGSELKQRAGCRGPCPMAGGRRRQILQVCLVEEASQDQEKALLCLPLQASIVNWTGCGKAPLATAIVTGQKQLIGE